MRQHRRIPAVANEEKRPFSDRLLEAAMRIDEFSHPELAKLLMKAAVRLRVIAHTGARLEHIPVYAYNLLRQISRAPVRLATLHGREDKAAVSYLLTRRLAEMAPGDLLTITTAGEELGEIAEEQSSGDRGEASAGSPDPARSSLS
jgi:hypothetical protein